MITLNSFCVILIMISSHFNKIKWFSKKGFQTKTKFLKNLKFTFLRAIKNALKLSRNIKLSVKTKTSVFIKWNLHSNLFLKPFLCHLKLFSFKFDDTSHISSQKFSFHFGTQSFFFQTFFSSNRFALLKKSFSHNGVAFHEQKKKVQLVFFICFGCMSFQTILSRGLWIKNGKIK